MLKIQLKSNNSKENQENIELDDIFLSSKNPRYTLTNLKEQDLSYYQEIDNFSNNDVKTALVLLKQEGDLEDFFNLLESIINSGFNNHLTDYILLIQAKQNNQEIKNKYVVMEGNRRILALKLLVGLIQLPNWDELEYSLDNSSESILDNEFNSNDKETNLSKQKKDNYKKIKKLLEKFFKEKENDSLTWEVNYDLVSKFDVLIKIIYSKHVTGEKIGLRRWSRSKYYADLINIFPNGINLKSKETQKYINDFQRDVKMIIEDFKQAQFVYRCFYYGNYNELNKEQSESYLEEDEILILNRKIILEKMTVGEEGKISALEFKHSLAKIKDTVVKNFYVSSKEEFDQNYFHFSFDENNYLIKINPNNKIEEKKMFQFIYDKWKKRIITTRPIKDKDLEEFKSSLLLFLLGNYQEDSSFLTNEQAEQFDAWTITDKKTLKTFIDRNLGTSVKEEIIDNWKLRLKILENDDILNKLKLDNLLKDVNWETDSAEKLKSVEPIAIFEILIRQYKSINKIYINALAITIRSLWEQVIIWTAISYLDNTNGKEEIKEKIKSSFHFTNSSNNDLRNNENIFNASKINGYIQNLINVYLKKDNYLREVLLYSASQNTNNDEIINPFINLFLESMDEKNNNKNGKNEKKIAKNLPILNEMIHASHRIYGLKQYKKMLNIFELMQKLIFKFLTILDFKKIISANKKFIRDIDILREETLS